MITTTSMAQPEANDKALADSAKLLIDLSKIDRWVATLVLFSCFKEIGNYDDSQKVATLNGIWEMVGREGISVRDALDFCKEKRAKRRRKALDEWWRASLD